MTDIILDESVLESAPFFLDATSNQVNYLEVVNLMANGNIRRADNGPVLPAVLDSARRSGLECGVASFGSGAFVAVYEDSASPPNLYAAPFTCAGGVTTPGAPVLVATNVANLGVAISVTALSSTLFAVGYIDNTTSFPTVVACSFDGTTIVPGTAVTVNALATTSNCSVAALSATAVAVTYSGLTNFLHGMVCTVAGTVVTTHTDTVLVSTAPTNGSIVTALDATHFAVSYGGAASAPFVVAASVSGTTITAGAAVQVVSAACTGTYIATLDATHFVVSYIDGSNAVWANVASVSGTTITKGTSASVATAGTSSWIAVTSTSATTFILSYGHGTQLNGYNLCPTAIICTQVSGTITAGTEAIVVGQGGVTAAVAPMDTTDFVSVMLLSASNQVYGIVEAFVGRKITNVGVVVSNTLGVLTQYALPGSGDRCYVAGHGAAYGLARAGYNPLTPNSTYYWDRAAGGFTTVPTNDVVGLSLSSTSILIAGGRNRAADQFFG